MKANQHCVLTIAGTDPSGGAGIQADIKTISATGCYAASVITALVAQNTQGVQAIQKISPDFVLQQLQSVFTDLKIDAVKIGMLNDKKIIDIVAGALIFYKPKFIVIDPVMVAKNGSELLPEELIHHLKSTLLPLATVITPNLYEAEKLFGSKISTEKDMEKIAKQIGEKFSTNVLLKGGHLENARAMDVFYNFQEKIYHWLSAPRINTRNTHGTGCTLSAAIASYLAQGKLLIDAIDHAKKYLTNAILSGSNKQIGLGFGPVDHFYFLEAQHK